MHDTFLAADHSHPGDNIPLILVVAQTLEKSGTKLLRGLATHSIVRGPGPGHTVVTILFDGGSRYQSKLFNPAFLRGKGLPAPAWLQEGAEAHAEPS